MIKLNKIKILIMSIVFIACLFFLLYKPILAHAEEECIFDSSWKSKITESYTNLTQIDFLKTAPTDYEDTNQTISTDIKVFRSSSNSTKIAFVYDGVIKAPVNSGYLFSMCSNLTTINFDNFITTDVTQMQFMFNKCENLTSLDLDCFDTSKVITMQSMFSMCTSLTSLDLTGFSTPELQVTSSMFDSCSKLTFIDISSFDTSKVVNMLQMFNNCSNLSGSFGKEGTAIKIGEGFNTAKVFTINNMFNNCSKLISLDLSGFDFSCLNTNPYMPNGTSGVFTKCAFNVFIAPSVIPEGIEINLGGGKYYDRITDAQYTILDSSLAGRRLIKHNVHTPVDCVCTTCGFINHNYGDWIEEKPAYCGMIGAKAHYHCDKCNKNFDAEFKEIDDITIIATEHKYSEDWSKDEANHWHECLCGLKKDEGVHTFGDWKIARPATVQTPGERKRSCTVCEYEQTEVIYHTHTYPDTWSKDEVNHWHECECGERSEEAAHTFGNWIVTKESTQETPGERKRICSVCAYEQIEEYDHTHTYPDAWSKDEVNHWHECECGDKSEEGTHTFGEWEITETATVETPGKRKRVCSVCAYEQIEEYTHTHNYSSSWKFNETHHWYECECKDKSEEGTHTFGEWEITETATVETPG
ncbi:MAG: DUF285 domain-containing protein, partial [Anaeroplasmataceae bacterium]|nr:DUF285 domain-containing protein [Anaeroplasmataceae bacterium]